MNRVLCNTNSTVRGLRNLSNIISRNAINKRNIAYFKNNDPYLANLLTEGGLYKFLTPNPPQSPDSTSTSPPPTTTDSPPPSLPYSQPKSLPKNNFEIQFRIDRNKALIQSFLLLDSLPPIWTPYPPYMPYVSPLPLNPRNFINGWKGKEGRILEVMNSIWSIFCINDFVELNVKGIWHDDGSMSFPECRGEIDESAIFRQPKNAPHIVRSEQPDELEAEKSFLVYRK